MSLYNRHAPSLRLDVPAPPDYAPTQFGGCDCSAGKDVCDCGLASPLSPLFAATRRASYAIAVALVLVGVLAGWL